jgi:hypothetical protein
MPLDIPWKLIAVSPATPDTQFCNKRYPLLFRGAPRSRSAKVHDIRAGYAMISNVSVVHRPSTT